MRGDLTLEQARAFGEFPLVWAGEHVDGLPLTAILRRNDTAVFVSFVYGDCRPPPSDGGCAPPVEIQVWPAARRNLDSYGASPGALVLEPTRIRGHPATYVGGRTRLEILTGPSTVVVFADSSERLGAVVAALRCLTGEASGAHAGTLDC